MVNYKQREPNDHVTATENTGVKQFTNCSTKIAIQIFLKKKDK